MIAEDPDDDDEETVTVSAVNSYVKGKIRVIKRFSGVDTLPAEFVITANWEGLEEPIELRPSEEQPENVTMETSETDGVKSYTWTIDYMPVGTEVTFTEDAEGCRVAGYIWSSTVSVNDGQATDGVVFGTATVDADKINYVTITNTYVAGVELPATGGSGTLIYTVAGMALIVLASVLLVSRRKRKA